MKRTLFIPVFLLYFFTSNAQHKISGYVGWTASKLEVYSKTNATINNLDYGFLHTPYLAFEYEYDWKKLRFSTGLSGIGMGASDFFGKDTHWGGVYINIPILAGINWDLPKNWGLMVESGVEAGLKLVNIGDITTIDDMNNKVKGNINAVLGLESNWKRFRFGVRLQVGLTDFNKWSNSATLKHVGVTTYLGYTLWDSGKKKASKMACNCNF